MSVAPKSRTARIAFFKSKIAPWTSGAATLKIDPADVTALNNLVTAAESERDEFIAAHSVAKSKTTSYHNVVDQMTVIGMELIDRIRATARTGGDAIYALAQLPVPNPPSPIGPPGVPSDFKVSLGGDGSVKIGWTCEQPAGAKGTTYRIYRKLGASGPFVYIAGSGGREYTDPSIPAGVTQVTYKIQGVRSTAIGGWATFNVLFGSNEAGEATASVTAGESSPKLAA